VVSRKTSSSKTDCEKLLVKARRLIESEKLYRAKKLLKSGLQQFPSELLLLVLLSDVYRALGDRCKSLKYSKLLITHHPTNWNGYARAAQDLIILKRFKKARAKIQEGLKKVPIQIDFLTVAIDVYRASGDREKALKYSEMLIAHFPQSWTGYVFAAQDKLSLGKFQPLEYQEQMALCQPPSHGKNLYFWKSINEFKNTSIEKLWIKSFKMPQKANDSEEKISLLSWQPFQYWSQGKPPSDIIKITKSWNKIFRAIGVRPIKMFDKSSALEYIKSNCLELLIPFKTSFHYAVEADVFRVAYAQKNNCIWLDCDLYPKSGTQEMLKTLLLHRKTTLYFREKRPWLVNGFFIAPSASLFFARILNSTKDVDFSLVPHDLDGVVKTFGPDRYNQVFTDILKADCPLSDILSADRQQSIKDFNFVNEHTFASVNPPFELRYKTTNDSWQFALRLWRK